jgi:hypothetical protein
MKKLIICLLIVFVAIGICRLFLTPKEKPFSYISEREILQPPVPTPSEEELEVLRAVEAINGRREIGTLVYKNIEISISQRPNIRLTGTLYCQSPQNVRFRVYSPLGQETDMGSNEQLFWFWSKRMKPSALYYADHDQIYNTRLRTPFHPGYLIESLGVKKIETMGSHLSIKGNYYKITQQRKGMYGQPVIKTTLIDREKIVAHYLHDHRGMIASWEIKEHYATPFGYFPKVIIITWHEENSQTRWDLDPPCVNTKSMIPISTWMMPNYKPKIDLANEPTICSFWPQ